MNQNPVLRKIFVWRYTARYINIKYAHIYLKYTLIKQENYMDKDVLIKYLPYGTTQEELKQIRHEFKDKNTTLILIVSGQEKLLDNLHSLMNID